MGLQAFGVVLMMLISIVIFPIKRKKGPRGILR